MITISVMEYLYKMLLIIIINVQICRIVAFCITCLKQYMKLIENLLILYYTAYQKSEPLLIFFQYLGQKLTNFNNSWYTES